MSKLQEERRLLLDSPLGPLGIVTRAGALCRIDFDADGRTYNHRQPETAIETGVVERLTRYFNGHRETFDDVPVDIAGATPFRQAVWKALRRIPYGEVRSYKWLSEQVGQTHAFRAVGGANRSNPIPIIIPCHRVIQANGKLGGYQGKAGLHIKTFLLRLEDQAPENQADLETRPDDTAEPRLAFTLL